MFQDRKHRRDVGQYSGFQTLSSRKVRTLLVGMKNGIREMSSGVIGWTNIFIFYNSMTYSFTSVGYISRSGGLSNELNNIIARNTDGVNEGLAIGGDR